MNVEDYTKEKLWLLLVETAHTHVMYPTHKAYTRDVILKEKPNITTQELSTRLNMSLGEAMVILEELQAENNAAT